MKKTITLCTAFMIMILCSLRTNATVVTVNVEDFEFSPSDFTINVGDQVMWMWDNSAGAHTTTSTTIPTGAASWDQPINQSAPMFTYTATVAGSYDYICTFHASMGMVGHFTVLNTTGVTEVPTVPTLSLNGASPIENNLQLIYSMPASEELNLYLIDMAGKKVMTFFSANKPMGIFTETYSIAGIRKGVYFLEMEAGDSRISNKIVIQ